MVATDYLIFQAKESTLEDLISSGKLEVVTDQAIREALATWESNLMTIRSLETDHKKAFNNLLEYYKIHAEPYQIMRGRGMIPQDIYSEIISDPLYLNTFTYHAIPLKILNMEYLVK